LSQYSLPGLKPLPDGRREDDYYPTPQWLIDAAVSRLGKTHQRILDPGAGDGRLAASAVKQRAPHPCEVTAVELNEERAAAMPDDWKVVCGSYTDWAAEVEGKLRFDLIITNPPFSLWLEFVQASLRLLDHNGILLALGFSNVLGSQRRAGFWQANKPSWILQSSRRPRYRSDRNSGDPRESIWVQWGPGKPRDTRLDWL
jgi:predicted RNA methylase